MREETSHPQPPSIKQRVRDKIPAPDITAGAYAAAQSYCGKDV